MRNTILGSLILFLASSTISCATVETYPDRSKSTAQKDDGAEEFGILDGFEFFNLLHSVGGQSSKETLTSSR
ncbi:MAG: hypothetical protein EOP04_09555 [Proteobacteria bacterium]|nr:MAG: hypothetical protein EOP04_09555 [Pseudomonadota bacterium]